jgi:hypothetical protein
VICGVPLPDVKLTVASEAGRLQLAIWKETQKLESRDQVKSC